MATTSKTDKRKPSTTTTRASSDGAASPTKKLTPENVLEGRVQAIRVKVGRDPQAVAEEYRVQHKSDLVDDVVTAQGESRWGVDAEGRAWATIANWVSR